VSVAAHPERPFDLEDLIAAPDDGYRYEVLDGALVVNAAPTWRHQEIVARLLRLLEDAAPPGIKVLPSPVWRIGPGQVPEPDLVVVDVSALGDIAVEGLPMLVVEVLSPSNRGSDLVRKRALYAEAGCSCYWIVDPEGPVVTLLELDGHEYHEESTFTGGERVTADRPFRVDFASAQLLARTEPPASGGQQLSITPSPILLVSFEQAAQEPLSTRNHSAPTGPVPADPDAFVTNL
jgi:Uma2 family endonuclease